MSRFFPFDTAQASTLEKLLANAGGGSDLGIVDFGLAGPLGASQVLFCVGVVNDIPTWTNVDHATIAYNSILQYLVGLPGFAAGNILAVNATEDGFEWVAP